jgi:hypothetical protein
MTKTSKFTGIGPTPARTGRFWAAWMVAWLVVGGYGLARLAAAPAKPHDPSRAATLLASHAAPVPSPARKTKSIEEIRPGDRVMARDDASGEVAPRRVKQVFRNTSDHLRVVRLRSESGDEQELRTTDEHPFFVPGRGWTAARSLEAGMALLQSDGRPAMVAATAREPHPEGVAVYNFEVEDAHNYFVAQAVDLSPVLVHNTCEGGVYVLRDSATGQVMRSGRTNNLARRRTEHARDPALGSLKFEVAHRTDVYSEQRGLEQLLHETHNPPRNRVGGIDPRNPNLPGYREAARRFLDNPPGGP